MGTTATPSARTVLEIPVELIDTIEGHNPRQRFEGIEELAANIAQNGQIVPGVVRATGERFELIAGERRLRALRHAGLPTFRAELRDDERPRALAVLENAHRSDLNPVEQALAIRELKETDRLSVREIAARLAPMTQKTVRERLQLAALDERIQAHVASGALPLKVVAIFTQIAKVHPGLAVALADRVVAHQRDDYGYGGVDLDDLEEHGVAAALACADPQLGVYRVHARYDGSDFDLSDEAQAAAAALPRYAAGVVFGLEDLDAARAYGCALAVANHSALICDRAFASQRASEKLVAKLKAHKEQEATPSPGTAATGRPGAEERGQRADGELSPQQLAQQAAERRKRSLELAQAQRNAAIAFHDELGAALFRDVARVKIDARVIELLALSGIGEHGAAYAARGLRYTHPGWKTVETTRGGKAKRTYPDVGDCATKLGEFLDGATGPQFLAGRLLQTLLAALLADPREVAMSNRLGHQPPHAGGYNAPRDARERARALLRELVWELVPEHLVTKAIALAHEREQHDSLGWLRRDRPTPDAADEMIAQPRDAEAAGPEVEAAAQDAMYRGTMAAAASDAPADPEPASADDDDARADEPKPLADADEASVAG